MKLLDAMMHQKAESEGEQVVVLSQVLAAEINLGYEEVCNTQVKSVNGVTVKNLKHLVELVTACQDKYLRFDLEYSTMIVLETETARKSNDDILSTHGIGADRSSDLSE